MSVYVDQTFKVFAKVAPEHPHCAANDPVPKRRLESILHRVSTIEFFLCTFQPSVDSPQHHDGVQVSVHVKLWREAYL